MGHRLQDTFIEVFQMLDPETRKKVLEHLRELIQARRQNEGGKIGFFAWSITKRRAPPSVCQTANAAPIAPPASPTAAWT